MSATGTTHGTPKSKGGGGQLTKSETDEETSIFQARYKPVKPLLYIECFRDMRPWKVQILKLVSRA